MPDLLNLLTDVPGLRVGNAQDARLKSGVTVCLPDEPATASVAIHGGAPGTREAALLDPRFTVEKIDALVLSGGSAFGLDAGSGVQMELAKMGRGFAVGDAVRAAARDFDLGSVGAGTGATTATLKGGLGSASLRLENGATLAALVAVNALGSATMGDTPHFWAAPFERNGEFGALGLPSSASGRFDVPRTKLDGLKEGANTTIAIVATDLAMTKAELQRLAVMAHDGFARALWPAHTALDGDLVFALSTARIPQSDPLADGIAAGAAAASVMSRAIARGVHAASPAPGDRLPTWGSRFG
eukprot:jgi/Tetstr1/428718/TSEL_018706.t1